MAAEPPSVDERFVNLLTSYFTTKCEREKLQIFTAAADRHGSLVWEAGWEYRGARYITLSATPRAPNSWQLQLWAAAADDLIRVYTRAIAYDVGVGFPKIGIPVAFLHDLNQAFRHTIQRANHIVPGDPDITSIVTTSAEQRSPSRTE